MILLVVVAVAVTVVTAGAAVAALGPAGTSLGTGIATVLGTSAGLAGGVAGAVGVGGAIAIGAGSAALGSIVSQGVGVATGLQDKFSWKGVALAAITGGVTGGLSATGALAKVAGSPVLGAVARGAASNFATQGIAVAAGLQKKFDWTGVAVGAVVGGAVGAVSDNLRLNLGSAAADKFGTRLISGMAGSIAGGATRSLITGTDFGDNIMATLPDVLGQTIGQMVAGRIASAGRPRLGYANVGTDDGLAGGGATGAGDGTLMQPQVGEGGGQVGKSASSSSGGDVASGASGVAQDAQFLGLAPLGHEGNATGVWTDDAYVVTGKHMNWLQKAWYDVTHPVSQIINPTGEWFNGTNQPAHYGSTSALGYGRGEADVITAASAVRIASSAPPIAITLGGDAYLGVGASGSLGFSFDMRTGQFRRVTSGGAGPGYGAGVGLNFSTGERIAGAQTNINFTAAYGLSGGIQAPLDLKTGNMDQPSGGGIGRDLPGAKAGPAGFGPRAGAWANGSIDYTSPATPPFVELNWYGH